MRQIINFNTKWAFSKEAEKVPEKMPERWNFVNLPHSWNDIDGQDGGNDYFRGTSYYAKELEKADLPEADAYYLEIRGANSSAVVFANGKEIGRHDGGYSTWRVNITDTIAEKTLFVIAVDNAANDRVYPQAADFTFYGGLYRDVNIIAVSKSHFDLDYYGGPGIRVTPEIAGKDAKVEVEVFITKKEADQKIAYVLKDAEGNVAAETTSSDTKVDLNIENVHLWHGRKDPYLYTAEAKLMKGEDILDHVVTRFGCRTFQIDPDNGFILNGEEYPLRGVSRHQDRWGRGNALLPEHHREDMDLICEVGATTIRLAHYQHDQYFYDLCDQYGMVVWAEIPYISEHLPGGRSNTISQAKELVIQNYNHPSIVVWGVSNEITISTKDKADMLDNHRVLNDLYHQMDPTRLTTLACYAMCGPFNKTAHITDVVSWNLYLGWYVPGLFLNDFWIDFFHKCYPDRPLGYSEYGCEAMPNLHSSKPHRGDHTEEYQCIYHEYMLRCFEHRPFLWATHVWNMFDFAADARDQGGEPGMNHKGLVTFDRKTKKDSFYLYKAWWSDEPFVHICGSRYVDRPESTTKVKIYSNQGRVALYANGKLVEEKAGDKVFEFKVPLEGDVELKAVAGNCTDLCAVRRVSAPNPAYKLHGKSSNSANWV